VTGNPDLPVHRHHLDLVVFSVVLQLMLGLLIALALNRGVKRQALGRRARPRHDPCIVDRPGHRGRNRMAS